MDVNQQVANPTIADVFIGNNTAYGSGGGVFVQNLANPTFYNTTIEYVQLLFCNVKLSYIKAVNLNNVEVIQQK